MNKIMVLKANSPAIHKVGDIRRECDDYIRIHSETYKYYIGNFEEGMGFINVKFKKEDCRLLTTQEINGLNGTWYSINGNPLYRMYIDDIGNVVNGTCTTKKGVIVKVTDTEGKEKHSDFKNLNVEFAEDIIIGKSIVFMTDKGYITTSAVSNLDLGDNYYIIHTKNSIYTIDLI